MIGNCYGGVSSPLRCTQSAVLSLLSLRDAHECLNRAVLHLDV